jgi:hypothetical protein
MGWRERVALELGTSWDARPGQITAALKCPKRARQFQRNGLEFHQQAQRGTSDDPSAPTRINHGREASVMARRANQGCEESHCG